MTTLEGCRCRGAAASARGSSSSSILYSILKSDNMALHQHKTFSSSCSSSSIITSPSSPPSSAAPLPAAPLQLHHHEAAACSCRDSTRRRRRGTLRAPQVTCKAASAVLVKTLRFVKSVPCFRELPDGDQLALVRSGWAALLVLGLAQDRVDFETAESAAEPSLLQRILTAGAADGAAAAAEPGSGGGGRAEVCLVDIQAIKAFLRRCWSLDVSTKEYAYLKGAVLFNPDVEGLRCLHYIQSLRRESHQALNEHVKLARHEDATRFAKLLIALSLLRAIGPAVVAQLFFTPVIGSVDMEEVLL
ncbi:hypothetical protein CRUP_009417 [Coryphaenoides rupestris]|nr:hypothetical protein CRUP_009417 [Coryphaenoides rupestris]